MFSVGFGRALFHTPLQQQRVCACEKFNRREICPDGRRPTALSQPQKLAELLELLELLKLLKLTVGAAEGCDLLILKNNVKRSQPSAAPTWVRSCNLVRSCNELQWGWVVQ
ncbi:hypothetical protein PMI37_03173 [Pseudomonas sp. GM80]|nr:hypothetical protein PMI37_03173 [Pseudomonas sp. GM80]